ncbi:hypothetical protein [Vibrio crassostreae]|uniref:hypothetical protein n=1 Tax=Vibrio crassostreae TaxID=246167 RepID=UPI001B31654E|nr:hypothetical protein [Vibrio crassostreae]
MDIEIRTDLFKKDPNRPGYLVLDRILTNKEVETNIENALKSIMLFQDNGARASAWDHAESCHYNYDWKADDLFPFHLGEFIVAPCLGSNEGEKVRVFISDKKTGSITEVYSIKYFCGIEMAAQAAIGLTKAFNNGYFG